MKQYNPVGWFEIYVDDMNRARKFYETVLEESLQELPNPKELSDMIMVAFPMYADATNSSGALVKMEKGFKPGKGGTLVYFSCEDVASKESRVTLAGGKVLQPKMSIGEYGYISLCEDTEGNVFGLHSKA